ncbi:MAG: FtsW/RodA/SpoVE family cell cycle protein [Defluviitaleaceae bacterium]|nr:FtsW/RodA/SpoVE family cell cycle protein [Defluviitaleaceae bacterium]
MKNVKRDAKSFDITLFVLVIVLSAFGLLMVGSATGLGNGNVSSTLITQLIFVLTGIGILLLAAFFNFETICKFWLPIYGVNIIFLVVVLFMPRQSGVNRWIGIELGGTAEEMGTMLGIQPSEFAKIFMVIFLASLIFKYREQINKLWVVGMILAATMLPVVLIFVQPSWSASSVSLVIMLAMLFVGGINWKYILFTSIIIIPAALFFFIELHAENPIILMDIIGEWQLDRILDFLYPELGTAGTYQNERALEALHSGLLTGRGLFNNNIRIPEQSNDFILSVIGAEFGFLGTVIVLGLLFVVAIRCFMIAHRAQNLLGKLIAVGVGSVIAFQTFLHTAVNTWILPNTGVNLPFISSGGSSTWVFLAMIGLVINVGMTREVSMFEDWGIKKKR